MKRIKMRGIDLINAFPEKEEYRVKYSSDGEAEEYDYCYNYIPYEEVEGDGYFEEEKIIKKIYELRPFVIHDDGGEWMERDFVYDDREVLVDIPDNVWKFAEKYLKDVEYSIVE